MTEICPRSKPQQTKPETEKIIRQHGLTESVVILGIRGYYRDTMGEPGKNDRAIYDDALFLYSPNAYDTFNANTDPTAHYREGLATLTTGLWRYKIGIHGLSKPKDRQYTALVQAAPVTVKRDGDKGLDRGMFGINIHKGSYGGTSSLGCQTIWPDQWKEFIGLVASQLGFFEQDTVPYLLIERDPA